MSARLADFYIIGAMKCATTTLHEQLARRDRFFMSTPKEPNFFNDTELCPGRISDYAALFTHARPDQIVGESSTHYTKLPTYQGTAERIFEHTPEAKLVYVMRDPIERLVSHYIHQWTERRVQGEISDAIFKYPEYVAYSSYALQLEPYVRLFGKEKITLVFFEHLVQNRESELTRIARALGDDSDEPLTWYTETAQTNVSKERLRKSRLREAALSFPPARMIKDALPGNLKERIKSLWRMEERPELSDKALGYATDLLDEDLEILGSWLGLELTCESFKSVATEAPPQWI